MVVNVVLVFLLIILYLIYNEIINRRYEKYFNNRGIVCERSQCILWKVQNILSGNVAEIMDKLYRKYENKRIFGRFDMGIPCYFLRDSALAKQIMVKGFDHFTDHLFFINGDLDPLFGNSLIALRGKRWKSIRSALSPAFTGSKMRQMFQLVQQCSRDMSEYFRDQCNQKGPQVYNMKELYSKFTNDVIASCAFGVKCDTFRDPGNDFFRIGQKMLNFLTPFNMFKMLIFNSFHSQTLGRLLRIRIIDEYCAKIFKDIILTTMKTRQEKQVIRPDMINLLMQLREGQLKSSNEREVNKSIATAEDHGQLTQTDSSTVIWTDDLLVSQCFIFFFAGFDTTSTLMTFAAYELALNTEVQEKLLEEIDATKDDLEGEPLDYDHLQAMTYLDQVIAETLRKWPPLAIVDRRCTKDYVHRDENGFELKIDEGSLIIASVYSFQRDPKNFPEPEKFYPERFSEENKSAMNMDAYAPFGIGPRNCIGSRFALMEVKSVIYHILLNFSFEVCDKTQIPIKLKKTLFGVVPEKVELLLKPRSIF